MYFNPRSRGGSDAPPYYFSAFPVIFQSTLPRRERHIFKEGKVIFYGHFNPRSRGGSDGKSLPGCRQVRNFNPRSRGGSDNMPNLSGVNIQISIHAPAEGATAFAVKKLVQFGFQSTLPRRERHHRCSVSFYVILFQSTLPRRERLNTGVAGASAFIFQSTLPRRERRRNRNCPLDVSVFQSTLPRRERLLHLLRFLRV